MNDTESTLARGFARGAEEIARFEAEAARLLDETDLPAVHKRDLRDRIEAIAERALRHAAALRDALPPEGGSQERIAERIDRLFLAELEASLEEGFRFMERRLGLERAPGLAPPSPLEADRALRSLDAEFQPSSASIDALGLVAERAAFLASQAEIARSEGDQRLDRELVEVKRKAFMRMAELAQAENALLLFKCRLALEARLRTGAPLALAPAAHSEGKIALLPGPGGSLQAELFERGLRLRMEFRAAQEPGLPAGSVEGWVESGEERAEFRLADPRRLMGAAPSAIPRPATEAGRAPGQAGPEFLEFLASHDLARLYGELLERATLLGSALLERERGDSSAARLSDALEDLL